MGQLEETKLRLLYRNIQGKTQDKLTKLLTQMDTGQIDVVSLVEAGRKNAKENEENQEKEREEPEITGRSRQKKPREEVKIQVEAWKGMSTFSIKNTNGHRGIEIWARSTLDPILERGLCRHDTDIEAITVRVRGLTIISVYLPDGTKDDGFVKLVQLLEETEVQAGGAPVLVLGDGNLRSKFLGNVTCNVAGKAFDLWNQLQEAWYWKRFSGPTWQRGAQSSFIDITGTNAAAFANLTSTQRDWSGPDSDHCGIRVEMRTLSHTEQFKNLKISQNRWKKEMERMEKAGQGTLSDLLQAAKNATQSTQTTASRTKQWYKPSKEVIKLRAQVKRLKKRKLPEELKQARRRLDRLISREQRKQFKDFVETVEKADNPRDIYKTIKAAARIKVRWPANCGAGRESDILRATVDLVESKVQHDARSELRIKTDTLRGDHRPFRWTLEEDRYSLRTVTGMELHAIIKRLPILKTPGPDKITYDLLKMVPRKILDKLAKDITDLLRTGTIPKTIFETDIKPLSKKAGSEEVRPISLANAILKVVDRAVLTRLTKFLEDRGTLAKEQYGFKAGHSAQDQVSRLIIRAAELKAKGTPAAIVSLDLSKAYDRVQLQILTRQLEDLQVPLSLQEYFWQVMEQRTVQVKTRTGSSCREEITAGLMQGLPSSPVLFNIYINGIVQELERLHPDCVFAFADDMNLIVTSATWDGLPRGVSALLRKASTLYGDVGAVLNTKKTKVIPLSHHRVAIPWGSLKSEVEITRCARILGIQVDASLCFQDEVATIIREMQLRGIWIKRLQGELKVRKRRLMYTSFLQGYLDYHILPIWPWLSRSSRERLESVTCRNGQVTLKVGITTSGALALRELDLLLLNSRWTVLTTKRIHKLARSPCTRQQELCQDYIFLVNREGTPVLHTLRTKKSKGASKLYLQHPCEEQVKKEQESLQAMTPEKRRLYKLRFTRAHRERGNFFWTVSTTDSPKDHDILNDRDRMCSDKSKKADAFEREQNFRYTSNKGARDDTEGAKDTKGARGDKNGARDTKGARATATPKFSGAARLASMPAACSGDVFFQGGDSNPCGPLNLSTFFARKTNFISPTNVLENFQRHQEIRESIKGTAKQCGVGFTPPTGSGTARYAVPLDGKVETRLLVSSSCPEAQTRVGLDPSAETRRKLSYTYTVPRTRAVDFVKPSTSVPPEEMKSLDSNRQLREIITAENSKEDPGRMLNAGSQDTQPQTTPDSKPKKEVRTNRAERPVREREPQHGYLDALWANLDEFITETKEEEEQVQILHTSQCKTLQTLPTTFLQQAIGDARRTEERQVERWNQRRAGRTPPEIHLQQPRHQHGDVMRVNYSLLVPHVDPQPGPGPTTGKEQPNRPEPTTLTTNRMKKTYRDVIGSSSNPVQAHPGSTEDQRNLPGFIRKPQQHDRLQVQESREDFMRFRKENRRRRLQDTVSLELRPRQEKNPPPRGGKRQRSPSPLEMTRGTLTGVRTAPLSTSSDRRDRLVESHREGPTSKRHRPGTLPLPAPPSFFLNDPSGEGLLAFLDEDNCESVTIAGASSTTDQSMDSPKHQESTPPQKTKTINLMDLLITMLLQYNGNRYRTTSLSESRDLIWTRIEKKRIKSYNEETGILLRIRSEQVPTRDWLFNHKVIMEEIYCRLCADYRETLFHLIAECESEVSKEYRRKFLEGTSRNRPPDPENKRDLFERILTRDPFSNKGVLQKVLDKDLIEFLAKINVIYSMKDSYDGDEQHTPTVDIDVTEGDT